MTDDPEQVTVIAALPADQTAFEYLGSCWKRERQERMRVMAKKVRPALAHCQSLLLQGQTS